MTRSFVLGFVTAGLLAAAWQGKHWLALDGSDWASMGSPERTAWVQGFLAGQAVGQLHDSVRADTLAMARALEQMRREGVFNFPYAAPLYQSRLGDFYFWENHRSLPLWRAIGDVNRELRGGRQ
jgi:hypothetical protein